MALWSCLGLAHAWKFVSLQNRLLSVHQSLTSRLSFEELLPAIAAASRWAVGAKEKLSVLVLPYDSVRQTLLYTERSSDTSLITGMEWEEDDESETGADKDSEGSFESKATTGQREQFSFLMPVRRRRPSQVKSGKERDSKGEKRERKATPHLFFFATLCSCLFPFNFSVCSTVQDTHSESLCFLALLSLFFPVLPFPSFPSFFL